MNKYSLSEASRERDTPYFRQGKMGEGFPDSSVGRESVCNARDLRLIPGLERSAGEGLGYPLQYSGASLVTQLVKNFPAMRGQDSIPGLGRSSGEGKGYPLQYSGLKNSMDCRVHGVAKCQTQWSDFHSLKMVKIGPAL